MMRGSLTPPGRILVKRFKTFIVAILDQRPHGDVFEKTSLIGQKNDMSPPILSADAQFGAVDRMRIRGATLY
jgi:hypothetical protein